MISKKLISVFMLAVLFVIAGCSSDDNTDPEGEAGADSEKTGDITVGMLSDVVSLDLHG